MDANGMYSAPKGLIVSERISQRVPAFGTVGTF